MERLSCGRALASVIAVAASALLSGLVAAQENYPDHPVRIIVPFSPSGGTDIEGLDPVSSTPAELAALLKREIAKYGKTIEVAGIKL